MKRSKRKQEIYKESARLFRRKGYSAASIRDIADAVGLEPSSLYSHIRSKEEILIDICMDCAESFADGMSKIYNAQLSPLQQLDGLLDLHIDMIYYQPSSVTVFNEEWKHLPQDQLEAFLAKRNLYQDQFKSILADGIADGIWHPISTTTALNLIVNAVRWLHYYNNRLSEDDFVGMKNEIKSFIRRGLKCA